MPDAGAESLTSVAGEYPSSMAEALPELHVSGETALGPLMGKRVDIGSRTGLYHLVVGEGQNAFVGNGTLRGCAGAPPAVDSRRPDPDHPWQDSAAPVS